MKERDHSFIQLNLPILPAETFERIVGVQEEVVRLLAEMLLLAAEEIEREEVCDEAK